MITQLSRILTPSRCLHAIDADSRKRVLEKISSVMADELADVGAMDIFDLFIARERLGSTAMGHGVAIPHVRFTKVEQPFAVLCQLSHPVSYDAKDNQPVDLFFALLVPDSAEEAHLAILSQVAGLFRHEEKRNALRQAASSQVLYQQIIDYEREQLTHDGDSVPGLDNTDDTT